MPFGAGIAVLLLLLIGLLHLPYPLGGDQALFMVFARAMDQGATLYVDYWDLKQPGIFLFYWAAGKLMSFTEQGLHLFELLYLLAASCFIAATAPLRRPWLVPLAAYGTYYCASGWAELTQVEILVSLPVYFCLWVGTRRDERAWVLGLAGVCIGAVACFKLVLAPLPALLVLAGVRRMRSWFVVAAASVATVAPVLLWLAWRGALDDLLWTTFVFPRESVGKRGIKDLPMLLNSARWFFVHFAPWVIGAAAAIPWLLRARNRFFVLAAAWAGIGLALITAQVLSWWPYHFELIMLPVALLAVAAIEQLPGRWPVAAVAAGLLLYSPQMVRKLGPLRWQAGDEYRQTISPVYADAWRETRFLFEADATPGPVYVLGNPVYLWLSARPQVPHLDGWAAQYRSPAQWRSFAEDLRRTQPRYVFIESAYAELIPKFSPETAQVLAEDYRVKSQSAAGTWLTRHFVTLY